MQSDLVSYWRNIIGMLNILCPRPNQSEDSTVYEHLPENAPAGLSSSLSSALSLSEALSPSSSLGRTPNKKRKSGKQAALDAPGTAPSASSSKFVKKFMGMFSSVGSSLNDMAAEAGNNEATGVRQGESSPAQDGGKGKRGKEASTSVLENLDRKVHYDGRTDKEKEVKVPSLYVFDYGKPRYGLSHASWTLLVLTRCAIEDVILRLSSIDPSIIVAKPLMKVDDRLLRDLSQKIGVSGVIAEGDSEDEYSVSQFDRAESEGSMELVGEHIYSGVATPLHGVPTGAEETKPVETRERSSSGLRLFGGRSASKSGGGLQIQVHGEDAARTRNNSLTLPLRTASPRVPSK
jgi:hypothetical protein